MSKKKAFLLGFCLTLAVLVPVYLAVCAYSLSRTAPVEQKQQGVPVIQPLSTDARTLALMIYGDLDVSVLDELPPGRQKIDTFWIDSKKQNCYL